jgi:hypothetical protein
MSAPTAAAARSGALFRSPPAAGLVGLAFDSDYGKDQDDAHAFAWSAVPGRAQPPRRRKFNNGTHPKLIFVLAAPARSDRQYAVIKISTWLTAS